MRAKGLCNSELWWSVPGFQFQLEFNGLGKYDYENLSLALFTHVAGMRRSCVRRQLTQVYAGSKSMCSDCGSGFWCVRCYFGEILYSFVHSFICLLMHLWASDVFEVWRGLLLSHWVSKSSGRIVSVLQIGNRASPGQANSHLTKRSICLSTDRCTSSPCV